MKIGIIIPDRKDRPLFLANCLRMIHEQTVKPDIVELVNDDPLSDDCDITWRYRLGYERMRKRNLDIIFLMENDDYYAPDYIETMLNEWHKHGCPEIFGTNYTIYYNIKLFAWFTMNHLTRSSAMSTMLRPDLTFPWCADNEPYTDIHLWDKLKGVVFQPSKHICLGIKHGIGLCGGRGHNDRLHRFTELDHDKRLLSQVMDNKSFDFYTNYFQ